MMDNPIDWGKVITRIKKKKKLPLKTVAYDLGVSSQTVNCWKRGVHEPKYSMGAKLLKMAEWEIAK